MVGPFPDVAEQHLNALAEEQRVLSAGVAGRHGAIEHDDLPGRPDPQDRNSGNRADRPAAQPESLFRVGLSTFLESIPDIKAQLTPSRIP